MLTETQSISLSILRASVEKLFMLRNCIFLWRIVATMS